MSDEFEDHDDNAPGWDAIDRALDELYDEADPMHWGTLLPYNLGGEDPLYGVSVYQSTKQQPHLHYITYGFSDLYEKESDDPEWSGYGFELTFRMAAETGIEPPVWVVNFLQNLARYVFETGNGFGPGHTIPLHSPICLEMDTLIRTVTFNEDPELGVIETPHGKLRFLQVVGLTDDELDAIQSWNALRFQELIQNQNPLLITDVERESHLAQEEFAKTVEDLTRQEGASAGAMHSDEFRVIQDSTTSEVTLILGAIVAFALGKRLTGRLPFDREFRLVGKNDEIVFQPGDHFECSISEHQTIFRLTNAQVAAVSENMHAKAGEWNYSDPPRFRLIIEKSEIKDNEGNITEILG